MSYATRRLRALWTMPGIVLVLAAVSVSPASGLSFFEFHGFSYLDGPAWTVGTEVSVPARFNAIQPDPVWPLDLTTNEYTVWVGGMAIESVQVVGPIRTVTYGSAPIAIYRDDAMNSDWAPNPPNGLVPSTFADGEPELIGVVYDMTLVFNTTAHSGAVSGTVDWTGGTRLAELESPTGWTYFGGVSDATGLGIPAGYDMVWDPQLYGPETPSPVRGESWGVIKDTFRSR